MPRRALYLAGLAALFLAGLGLTLALRATPSPGPTPAPGVTPPPPGDTSSGGQGQPVSGISCDSAEQFVYHVHAHLFILLNGSPVPISAQVGIPAGRQCFYWMHTHDNSGVIHIESPTQRLYTLGQFFDIWGQPLGRNGVATYDVPDGDLTVFVDGVQYDGDPHDIPLRNRTQVVLELGSAGPPPSFDFGGL